MFRLYGLRIYSLQNKVKTVEVDPLSKEIKISVSEFARWKLYT